MLQRVPGAMMFLGGTAARPQPGDRRAEPLEPGRVRRAGDGRRHRRPTPRSRSTTSPDRPDDAQPSELARSAQPITRLAGLPGTGRRGRAGRGRRCCGRTRVAGEAAVGVQRLRRTPLDAGSRSWHDAGDAAGPSDAANAARLAERPSRQPVAPLRSGEVRNPPNRSVSSDVATVDARRRVALARERQDGVRSGVDATADARVEVHAEERELRVRHRVDQRSHEVAARWRELEYSPRNGTICMPSVRPRRRAAGRCGRREPGQLTARAVRTRRRSSRARGRRRRTWHRRPPRRGAARRRRRQLPASTRYTPVEVGDPA